MRRRRVLAALGTSIPFAGCLSTATGDEISGETPTSTTESDVAITTPAVSQGETANITIDAQSVTHLRFTDVPDIDAAVEYGNAEFSPAPSAVWQTKPPTWQWSPSENLTGDVPVAVPETVAPDDYQYVIAVRQDDSEDEVMEGVTVTVRD